MKITSDIGNSFFTLHPGKVTLTSAFMTILVGAFIMLSGCRKDRDETKKVDIKLVAENLVSPVGVVSVPDQSKRLFVIDQIGKVWIIDASGAKLPDPFIDVSSRLVELTPDFDERGLLGLAFHPDYKYNGRFFIYYSAPPRTGGPEPGELWNNHTKVSEFRVSSANPNKTDMSSEKVVLQMDDPQFNHNAGTIAFGPDGYLYIAVGDGGGADDVGPGHVPDWYLVNEGGNGQDVSANLFGNILRIDVNSGDRYGIPHDNPFVKTIGRDEIYAYGFRNPYRFSFDMGGSQQLIVGDAGQVLYEEIDVVVKGGNYGWNVKEGTHCFNAANNMQSLSSCPDVDPLGNRLIDPVIEINNWQNPAGGKATTVIGGNVYRGKSIQGLYGKYIFGTFSQNFSAPNAELFMANPKSNGLWAYQEIELASNPNDIGQFLKGFGQDNEGEIYITTSTTLGPSGTTGKVFKLVLADNSGAGSYP